MTTDLGARSVTRGLSTHRRTVAVGGLVMSCLLLRVVYVDGLMLAAAGMWMRLVVVHRVVVCKKWPVLFRVWVARGCMSGGVAWSVNRVESLASKMVV